MNAASSFPSSTPAAAAPVAARPPLIILYTDLQVKSRDITGRYYIGPNWHIMSPESVLYAATWRERTAPTFPGQIIKTAGELGLDDAFVLAIDAACERAWRLQDERPSAADRKILTEDWMAITRVICAWYRRRAALAAWAAQNRA